MKITFDGRTAYIYLAHGVFDHTEDLGHGVMADVTEDGQIIGIEVLDMGEP